MLFICLVLLVDGLPSFSFWYTQDFSIWTENTFSFGLGLPIRLMAKLTVVSYLLIIHKYLLSFGNDIHMDENHSRY